jgi:hypothetical protein
MQASQTQLPATLASQPLPRRVRDLLNSTLKLVADEMERGIGAAVKDFDQEMFRQVELSIEPAVRAAWHSDQDLVLRSRGDLVLHFLNALESELAHLQNPQVLRGHLQTRYRSGDEMALVHDLEIEETSALTEAATRAELQNSLQLFLLGQRFGVLAGRPAFDVELLPVGPQALCRSLRRAAEKIGLDMRSRLFLYRAFDRQVMPVYGTLVEAINTDLARGGVLPHLQYVPIRARRTAQNTGSGAATAEPSYGLSLAGAGSERTARAALRSRSGRPDEADGDAVTRQAAELLAALAAAQASGGLASEQGFSVLRQLMASRRQLLGKLNPDRSREGREDPRVVSGADLQEALRGMQSRQPSPVLSHGRVAQRNVGHLKQDMLAMLRRGASTDEAPALAEQDNDALDLVGMLYDNLMRDVKPGSAAAALLGKLQVPLMRVALQDPAFFTRKEHPARQMLNTVAETSARWLDDDDGDGGLATQMNSIIDRAVQDYKGDPGVFKNVMQELLNHLQTLSRKAEVAERRHVEAARGKEKLTLAREQASRSVEALIKNQKLPRFTRTMLSQAWTDVMALTALRQGEDSPQWQRQLQVAARLIEIAQEPAGAHADDSDVELALQREIEEDLSKVGYQGDDVSAIARRLVHPNSANKDDASSRTELTMRLKARARLGEETPGKRSRRMPLSSAEEAEMERIQQAPIGTWFEFVINPQGDRVRRRLSWLSTATGDALFVNQRGQKNAEYTLDSLARLLAKGQVRIVEDEPGTALDRAWDGVLHALKSFALPPPGEGASTP